MVDDTGGLNQPESDAPEAHGQGEGPQPPSSPSNANSPHLSEAERIDQLCDTFEAEFRRTERPPALPRDVAWTATFYQRMIPEVFALERELCAVFKLTFDIRRYYQQWPEYSRLIDEQSAAADQSVGGFADQNELSTDITLLSPTEIPDGARKINQFSLISELGAGGNGTVWLGWDNTLRRQVAIKLPHLDRVHRAQADAFVREARFVAGLRHENIVMVHEVGVDAQTNCPFIVSAAIDGPSLKSWLETPASPLPPRQIALWMAKLARAIHYAHCQGVIHRDLKPANILIDGRGEPYLTDFGLAKYSSAEESLSVAGQVMGTPLYMSPEQASGAPVTPATDIYSLGVVLYELLAGRTPFPRSDIALLLQRIQHEQPPAPKAVRPSCPRDLSQICMKCLSKAPAERYSSALALAADLEAYLADQTLKGIPVPIADRVTKWCWRHTRLLVTAAVAVIMTAVLVFQFFGGRPSPAETFRVAVETDPPGCEITAVRIDPLTGDPDPKQIFPAVGKTPLTMHLEPGDYLIVAVLDDQRFNEVQRRVLKPGEIPFAYPHAHARRQKDGSFTWWPIRIPRPDVSLGMAFMDQQRVHIVEPTQNGGESTLDVDLPAMYVALRDYTVGELRRDWQIPGSMMIKENVGRPAEAIAAMSFFGVMELAEQNGWRLPTSVELAAIQSAVKSQSVPGLVDTGQARAEWLWTNSRAGSLCGWAHYRATAPFELPSRTIGGWPPLNPPAEESATQQPVKNVAPSQSLGFLARQYQVNQTPVIRSLLAEQLSQWGGTDPSAPAISARFVRSVRPRRTAADFMVVRERRE